MEDVGQAESKRFRVYLLCSLIFVEPCKYNWFDSTKLLLLGHTETCKIQFVTEIERRELKNREDLAEV